MNGDVMFPPPPPHTHTFSPSFLPQPHTHILPQPHTHSPLLSPPTTHTHSPSPLSPNHTSDCLPPLSKIAIDDFPGVACVHHSSKRMAGSTQINIQFKVNKVKTFEEEMKRKLSLLHLQDLLLKFFNISLPS